MEVQQRFYTVSLRKPVSLENDIGPDEVKPPSQENSTRIVPNLVVPRDENWEELSLDIAIHGLA